LFDKKIYRTKVFSFLLLSYKYSHTYLYVYVLKSQKILFFGKVYKVRKVKCFLVPRINIAPKVICIYNNNLIQRWKRRRKWKMFSFSVNNLIGFLVNLRLLNLYTNRGFWNSSKPLKKKKKMKNN